MKSAILGILMGISMAFSFKKEGKISSSGASASVVMEVLTIIIVSLPTFL